MTITTARNESAPAEVEGSTRAALESASGDRHPLRGTYDGPALLVNTRAVTYVHVGSGQATTHLLRRNEHAPTKLGGAHDVREIRILAHDEDASLKENTEYARLAVNCLVVTGTAKTIPLLLARTLLEELQQIALENANLQSYAAEQLRLAQQAERRATTGRSVG